MLHGGKETEEGPESVGLTKQREQGYRLIFGEDDNDGFKSLK